MILFKLGGETRPQAKNGSGPEARRDPAAQAGRAPQSAELPFETRCSARVSTQTNKMGKTVLSDGLSFFFAQTAAVRTEGMDGRQERGKPTGWLVFHERAWRAESLAACGRRFELFLVDSGSGRNQKGISPVATGDSGLCPENPQPFEKGWRKLYYACGRDWCGKCRFCSSGNPVFHVKHFPTAVAILTRCVIIIEHIKIGPNGAKAALRPGKGYANG